MRKKIGASNVKYTNQQKIKINSSKKPEKTLHYNSKSNSTLTSNSTTSTCKSSNKYERFINNTVLQNCRRPQRRDWCGPTTVAETIQTLLGREYSVDQIAKMMNWSSEAIIGGKLGTGSVIKGVEACSFNRIKSKILTVENDQNSWNKLKTYINSTKSLVYYHEPGHHLLLTGYIEEPLINPENIWNHENLNKSGFMYTRHWLIKAEHNVKRPDYISQGILVPVEFNLLCKYLIEKKNCDLVLFHI